MTTVELLRRRLAGDFEVDPWGLDRDVVDAAAPLARLRWSIELSGRPVPEGPAVIVFSQRFGLSEPTIVAEALRRSTGRHLRIVGLPDVPVLGPTLRRFGSVLDHPEEVASLLREGALIGVPLGLELRHRHRAGPLAPDSLASVVTTGVPVIPVVAVGREVGRTWRVVVGEALPPVEGDHPLSLVTLAEDAQAAVQSLLDATLPPRFLT
jgi:hypothetical protein